MTKRQDGYANAIIGHGIKSKDSTANYSYLMSAILTDHQLMALYMSAMGRKIIDLVADESVKNWITVDGDEEEQQEFALQMLDDLDAEAKFADAVRWERLFGGSCILMLADDGGTFEDPLNEAKLQSIEQLRVYDKRQIFWNYAVLYDDPTHIKYGEPEYYQINPMQGIPFMVHESRLLMFKGGSLPEEERLRYQGWGLPTFQGMFDEMRNNGVSYELCLKIMERMSQAVLMLKDLASTLDGDTADDKSGEEAVKARLQLIDMARNIMNTIAIDAEDKYELHNMTLATIPDIIDRFGLALAAACNIPFTLLFGRSPAGMNATGESDLENWYNFIGQVQKRHVKKNIDRLVKLLMLCKKGLFRGTEPKKWAVRFNPLWLPTEKEQAETDNKKADTKYKEAQARQLSLQNKLTSRTQCMRDSGYTDEEIAMIKGEIEDESELDLSNVLGHGFK